MVGKNPYISRAEIIGLILAIAFLVWMPGKRRPGYGFYARQGMAKSELTRIHALELAYFAAHHEYGSFEAIGYRSNPGNRLYAMSMTKVTPAAFTAEAREINEGSLTYTCPGHVDVWTIDEKQHLETPYDLYRCPD
jgi:hypothetical protein